MKTKMKYEGHHVVQYLRLMGELTGIENMNKRRLLKEPEGFTLEEGGWYSCMICGESIPGNKTWWNLKGITCLDCHRNIKEEVISEDILKNHDEKFSVGQISSECDLHPSTVRKLQRQGLLHGRELKREDGSVYYTIYSINENKVFFEKYPRKPGSKYTIVDLLGNKIEL